MTEDDEDVLCKSQIMIDNIHRNQMNIKIPLVVNVDHVSYEIIIQV